jgi:hypothetical protein
MRLAILLCLAAVCGSALATRADLFDASGDAGRSLLQQTGTQCSGAITHCNACRYQFFRGTVTRAICTACDTGYVPKALGTVCCELHGWPGRLEAAGWGLMGDVAKKCLQEGASWATTGKPLMPPHPFPFLSRVRRWLHVGRIRLPGLRHQQLVPWLQEHGDC